MGWDQFGQQTWLDTEPSTWGDLEFRIVYYFSPPATEELARVSFPIDRSGERFWSHFQRGNVGRTVWKLIDGSYTEVEPDASLIAHVYLGGHIEEVDENEAAALQAAGYTVTSIGVGGIGGETGKTWDENAANTWDLVNTTVWDDYA